MLPLIETIVFIFGLVAIGYLTGLVGLLSADIGDAMSRFVVSVALPILLFRIMGGTDFGDSVPWALWLSYFTAIGATWVAGHFIATRVFGRERRAGIVAGVSAVFSNLLLLGLPFMREVYGPTGVEVISLVIAVHLPVVMAATVLLLAWESAREGAKISPAVIVKSFLTQLLTNPLIVGILAGLLWRIVGVELPGVANRLIDTLAGVAGPVALFSVGLSLLKYGLRSDIPITLVFSGLKLFFMPFIALLMALAIRLDPFSAKVIVTMAAMPLGVNPYLIASRFGVGEKLASSVMTLTTGLAALTSLFWVWLVTLVF